MVNMLLVVPFCIFCVELALGFSADGWIYFHQMLVYDEAPAREILTQKKDNTFI
jgi:hypothetical protein